MSKIHRRGLLAGAAALGLPAMNIHAAERVTPAPRSKIWTFDRLDRIGGLVPTVVGEPQIIDSPQGKAVYFNGVDDALFFDEHPLAGAETFCFEAIFRPDGGNFEQRWFHLAEVTPEIDPAIVSASTRFLFEIRVVGNEWYLDTFVAGSGYKQTLIFPERRYPIGQWYHVAQTFDGKTYQAWVNGDLQGGAEIPFKAQGAGQTSVGVRFNRIDWFKGAIAQARFTPAFVPPEAFLKLR